MDKGNKSVTLNPKASTFYDPVTGVHVVAGQTVELTPHQLNSKKVRHALNSGFLIIAEVAEIQKDDNKEIEKTKLKKKWDGLVKKGLTSEKLAEKFTREELVILAEVYDLELEDSDEPKDIVEALLS